ncbi:MAG: DUF3368 domain-containing protein [Candidatus Humimicrobiaceae bacterium]
MNNIISDATPLIYLAKIEKINLLKSPYNTIIISSEIKNEIIDEGKRLKEKDAFLIEKEIKDGFIEVIKVSNYIKPVFKIDKGELSILSLAKELSIKDVLIDEKLARIAAKVEGLTPRGTLFVILKNLKLKLINFDDFLRILNSLLEAGFRLKEEVYLKAIEEARKI